MTDERERAVYEPHTVTLCEARAWKSLEDSASETSPTVGANPSGFAWLLVEAPGIEPGSA
jgi:hypothetical protein